MLFGSLPGSSPISGVPVSILLGMAALIKMSYTFFLWRAVEESDSPKDDPTLTATRTA